MVHIIDTDINDLQGYFSEAEKEGLITHTFRRLPVARQQAVLEAILEEAITHGLGSLNIKRLARRAGVAIGSLYQYFNNRDSLLRFAVLICTRHVCDTFKNYADELAAMPLRDALAGYMTCGIEWSRLQAGLMQLFARAAYQGEENLAEELVIPIANAMREMVTTIFQQAASRGELRLEIDLEATARLVNALIIAAADSQLLPHLNRYFQVLDADISPERSLDALLELVLRGVASD